MEEKMKYSTRQQKIILECLQEYGDTFYTIDQFMELLRGKEIQIGRTTVYRGLERLQKEGAVLKVPSVEGAPAQYRFIRDEEESGGTHEGIELKVQDSNCNKKRRNYGNFNRKSFVSLYRDICAGSGEPGGEGWRLCHPYR